MTACACGKPIHKGMCSAKWAVRKANNGPTGMKPKEAPVAPISAISEEAIARRLFGDLADDVLLLRAQGHRVARFRDEWRIDRDVLSTEALCARASVLRKTLKDRADSRAARVVDGSEVVVEPNKGAQKPRADEPETVAGLAGEADAPAPHLTARVAQLEQRVEFLFAAVVEAVECRRGTLVDQVCGLEKLIATLRTA